MVMDSTFWSDRYLHFLPQAPAANSSQRQHVNTCIERTVINFNLKLISDKNIMFLCVVNFLGEIALNTINHNDSLIFESSFLIDKPYHK